MSRVIYLNVVEARFHKSQPSTTCLTTDMPNSFLNDMTIKYHYK